MTKTALITTEKKQVRPILIVDKTGSLGKALAIKLRDEFLIVFVSKTEILNEENIVYVPFFKKFPSIPDNKYSHIILISEKSMPKESVGVFAKKAVKDESLLAVIFNMENLESRHVESALKVYEETKVLIVGEIFSENFIFDKDSGIGDLIYKAKNFGKIQIPNDGAKEESPVLLEDAADAIIEAVFVEEKNKLFYVFPKNKTTILSIALMIKKKNPHIRLDFIKEKNKIEEKPRFPKEGKYMLSDPYDYDEKIKKINLENVPKEKQKLKEKNGRKIWFGFLPIFVFLISLLVLPILFSLFFLFLGNRLSYLDKGNYVSPNFFILADVSYSVLSQEMDFLGAKGKTEILQNLIVSERKNSEATFLLMDFSNKIKKILFTDIKNPQREFSSAVLEVKKAYLLKEQEKLSGEKESKVFKNLNNFLNISSVTADFWTDIFGFKRQKNYLVLLQDNLELRPGGGFIISYGILTLDKGKMVSFKTHKIDEASVKLNSRAEPPFAIRRYLPSVNWHLKDSNFNVDFSNGAAASSVFVNSENDKQIDGVIGVDFYFIRSLINVMGGIQVKGQKIDSNNLFSEVFENKDKNFLEELYGAIGEKIARDKNVSYLSLIKIISDSIYEKHLIFTFNNKAQQAAFSVNRLASTLSDQRSSENSINDFFGLNEANLGKNKANYFVARDISQEVTIDENGKISEKVKMSITNNSKESDFAYKNYLRLILPFDSSINSIKINGENQKIIPAITDPSIYEDKKFKPPSGLELEKYNQEKNTIYGFLVTVNPNDALEVEVEYDLLQKINFQKQILYSLRVFKQPGTGDFPFQFSITLPSNAQVVKYPKNLDLKEREARTSFMITKDEDISLTLSFR